MPHPVALPTTDPQQRSTVALKLIVDDPGVVYADTMVMTRKQTASVRRCIVDSVKNKSSAAASKRYRKEYTKSDEATRSFSSRGRGLRANRL
ncbi:hypothetical protein CKO51_27420 [Rhodopirellula sp. SM50]|nr:hypothetical protein [Rhodopirellula sp. SM50]PAY16285.1 hypothetical protein CKO51_27420 [Rhodopirellula sp. SM50]